VKSHRSRLTLQLRANTTTQLIISAVETLTERCELSQPVPVDLWRQRSLRYLGVEIRTFYNFSIINSTALSLTVSVVSPKLL